MTDLLSLITNCALIRQCLCPFVASEEEGGDVAQWLAFLPPDPEVTGSKLERALAIFLVSLDKALCSYYPSPPRCINGYRNNN